MASFWVIFGIVFSLMLLLGLIAMVKTFGAALTGRGPQGPMELIAWLAMHPFRIANQPQVVEGIANLIFRTILNLLLWSILIATVFVLIHPT